MGILEEESNLGKKRFSRKSGRCEGRGGGRRYQGLRGAISKMPLEFSVRSALVDMRLGKVKW